MQTKKFRTLVGVGCLALGLSAVAISTPAGAAEDTGARHRPRLTVEQRECLKDQGITRPVRPLTKEKREALKAAAKACDIKLPRHGHRPRLNLTDEQKQCLKDQGIARPIRPLTPEKRATLKAAAAACGIERPQGAPEAP